MAEKLHRLSRITVPKGDRSPDSIVRSKAINMNDRARGQEILMEAQGHWMAMWKYREDRALNKKYAYGDQLSEIVHVDGETMTEEQYIKKQGGVPLTMNLIRQQMVIVVGSYREQAAEPICLARDRDEQAEAETLSVLLQYNNQLNQMNEMQARTMEEFTIGGLVAHRLWYGWNNSKMDCWTDNVPPDTLIIDSNMRDVRGWDCAFIGQIHDLGYNDACSKLAKTPDDYERLASIYAAARQVRGGQYSWEDFGYSHDSIRYDFLLPMDASRCRVIEVWRKESKPRYRCHDWLTASVYTVEIGDINNIIDKNNRRWAQAQQEGIPYGEVPFITAEWFIDTYWHYYFLSPFGDILDEGDSPYDHKSHPYVFKPYPFIDGEIHSFVSDLRPLQRYNNRLLMLNDMIMRSSSKGLLLVPGGCLTGSMTEEKIAKIWAKPNGVLVIDSDKFGNMPQQVNSSVTNIGIHEMLSLNLKFLEDIGVNNALQGKASFAGESGTHAQIMAQNASTRLVDLLESFNHFQCEEAYKTVKNIQQYYDEKTVQDIVGRNAKGVPVNASKVLTIETDISIAQGKKTPAYRMLANDFYINLFNQQAIDTEQLLESVIDIPGADELLQKLRSRRQQIEQGQTPDNIPPELVQKVQAGLKPNPQAMAQLEGVMAPAQQAA
ncbi:MAG: hypothetical protein K6F72_00065 [Bacteroidales bacterium]|nr:hypothetical protein [Bacteroidales bacterium]